MCSIVNNNDHYDDDDQSLFKVAQQLHNHNVAFKIISVFARKRDLLDQDCGTNHHRRRSSATAEGPSRGPQKFTTSHSFIKRLLCHLGILIVLDLVLVGPRLHSSHRVHRNLDLQAGGGVFQKGSDVVFEEISDAVELHDVARLLAQPELVELDEEVAVEVVEVSQARHEVAVWDQYCKTFIPRRKFGQTF